MTSEQLGFWTTAAQLTAVLALALVLGYRTTVVQRSRDGGWRSFKLFVISTILGGTFSISVAFFTCLMTLSRGASTPESINSVSWALVAAFAFLVLGAAAEIALRVAAQPQDPSNPEPEGFMTQLAKAHRHRRSEDHTGDAEGAESPDEQDAEDLGDSSSQ